MTKAELHKTYEQWKREEVEAVELIEAVARYLDDWSPSPSSYPKQPSPHHRKVRPMSKLTPAQKRLLQTAQKHGSALANLSMRSRAGGAVLRAADRLVEMQLLKWPGYEISEAGRAAISTSGAHPGGNHDT